MLGILLLAGVSYLIGSIPFGFLVGRAKGIDLRTVGSGNIGSTNVYRALGLGTAILVFALDAGKGFAGTRIVPMLGASAWDAGYVRLICAAATILGSVAGVFMRFRGGKGVAAGAGVFLGLAPLPTGICLGIWVGLVALTKYVSVGSLAAAASLPVLVAAFNRFEYSHDPVFYLAAAVAAVVFVRHRANLKRLADGTENRVGGKRPGTVTPAGCGTSTPDADSRPAGSAGGGSQ